ncbi:unnamed protein product (mitochondrion) [Plasmodiophora brassicae]|uniref:Uncharacterized protein n=1 Tax=Plasmodiophora brassicae TaxID=37360 RepID=A0A0G4IT47_PLABS|nr:hypothetical protein PBRA_006433 [Plasmodiophora brassicae]SPQ94405.1 unnamed protein product [Plasmodiophora brassicae]
MADDDGAARLSSSAVAARPDDLSGSNWDDDNDDDDEKFFDAADNIVDDAEGATHPASPTNPTSFVNRSMQVAADDSESDGLSDTDDDVNPANVVRDAVDPVAESAAIVADEQRNQRVNLETGEVFPIDDDLPEFDTFDTIRSADPPPDVDEQEIREKKIRTGFFAKMLHRATVSDVQGSNQVKVKSHKKSELDMSALKQLQVLNFHNGPVWTMKWSPCGNYLATAGQDAIIRIWLVCGGDAKIEDSTLVPSAPSMSAFGQRVLHPSPYREFAGHKSDIIDLAWSRSSFLLSASMDKSVRLWHVSRTQCLSSFQHADFVTAVAFHPTESRRFLSASFDKKLRMWDILDHRVVDWAQTPLMITAAAFNPSGRLTAAGLYNGQVVFYQSDGLKYFTQIDCRNRHGKHKRGRKVTGLQFTGDGKQILISTNDSRVRLYDMDDYSMTMKFKGHENESLQIRAHFSEDYQYIISGSDNSDIYVWSTSKDYTSAIKGPSIMRKSNDRNDSYEYFKAHSGIVTVALLAPERTLLFATRAAPAGGPIRHIIVSSGYDGRIKVFENRGDPVKI